MDDLIKGFRYIQEYTKALKDGVENFSQALPVFTKKHIESQARRQLNSTRDTYLSAVSSKVENYVLIVELDSENWLANAVETGASAFDMKRGLLNGKNAKLSKKGFRYAHVPMGKDPNKETSGTEKGQEIQDRIRDVLMKPKFDRMNVKMNNDGTLFQSQKVMHNDPNVQGLYRTRKFDSPEHMHSGVKPKWQYVMFRTISDNPLSKSAQGGWQHPGIKPVHIFRKTERWLHEAVDHMLTGFIEQEISKIGRGR